MGNKSTKKSETLTRGRRLSILSGRPAESRGPSEPAFRILVLGDKSTGKTSVIDLIIEATKTLLEAEPENSRGKLEICTLDSTSPCIHQIQLISPSNLTASCFIQEIDGFTTPPNPDAAATVGRVDATHGRSFIALYVGDNNSRESVDNCQKWKSLAESNFKDIEASRTDFNKVESFLLINKVAEGAKPIMPFSEQENIKISWKLDSVLLLGQLDPQSQGIVRIAERLFRQLQRLAVAVVADDFCED